MTTINNSQLIEKVGGIEKAREIVEGAPESNFPVKWCLVRKKYVRQVGFNTQRLVGGEWIEEFNVNPWVDLNSLCTAIAEHDEQIKCWSCNKYMTKSQHSANDSFCIHCGNEVDLGCNHNFEDVTIYGDSHKTYQCTICEFRDEEAERHG